MNRQPDYLDRASLNNVSDSKNVLTAFADVHALFITNKWYVVSFTGEGSLSSSEKMSWNLGGK